MSSQRTRRIDRDTAEKLLCGVPAGAGPLADLLAAAAAPALAVEHAGEQAALAAFRAARLSPATEPRRRSMIQTALAKLLTVKVMAATVVASTALGGVALAASTGTLPTQAGGASASQTDKADDAAEGGGSQKSPEPSESAKAKKDDAKGKPSVVGLCRAYQAHPMDERGKAVESTAFTALVEEAGGKGNVAGYCKVVLAAKAAESARTEPTVKPSDSSSPKPTPTARPEDAGTRPEKPTPDTSPSPRQPGS